MSIKVDLSGLNNFKAKIDKLKQLSNSDYANIIAKHGAEIAKEKYGGSGNIMVTAETVGDGKAKIVSRGKQVSFLEYGIGTTGEKEKYQGKLPTQDIYFESPQGVQRRTKGWQYNYRKKQSKHPENHKDVIGFAPKAQMWTTANELSNGEATKAIQEYINKGD